MLESFPWNGALNKAASQGQTNNEKPKQTMTQKPVRRYAIDLITHNGYGDFQQTLRTFSGLTLQATKRSNALKHAEKLFPGKRLEARQLSGGEK